MKKYLLLLIVFIQIVSLQAANRYWVGGTGAWNNSSHWSESSGGTGGASVPTLNDDVFFDSHSFSADKQTVMVTTDAVCRNIDFTAIDDKAILSSASARSLTVYGSYKLSPLLWNGFKGTTTFASSLANNAIVTSGKTIIGNWVFNGTGSWLLQDDITTVKQVAVKFLKGSLNTNGKTITCGSFIGSSSQQRSLDLSSSEIYIKDTWDFNDPSNLTFNAGTSRIIFTDSLDNTHYKSGNLLYNSVSAVASACTPSGTPCANFTISITGTNVICNGNANGTASAIVLPAAGPYSYFWTPAPGGGQFTPNATGLGAGTYTLKVTNTTTGLFCFCSISITEPGVLFDFELATTPPTCNGLCNGTSSVAATGGTGAYSFLWSGGLGTNDTAINVCAGSYNVQVTDVNGCIGNTTIVVGQPAVLSAPGNATMVSCFGFCNGAASVSASGGTTPYSYDWTPGAPVGDGTANITNLCPGSYTCTVTDANLCTTTFDTIITQPPVLTLSVSHTNASCGGVCDGTGTASVTGGTAPYTYVWSNGSTTGTSSLTNTVSGLCAGTYTIQVTDSHGCFKIDSVIITQPPVLVATATGVNISCFGLCNGTAAAVVTGGTPPYSYDWTPGSPVGDGSANISSLCPGTYTVTVTDFHSCVDTGVITITQPPVLSANPTSTNILCFGACNGTATAGPTGGTPPYTYDWSPGAPIGDGTTNITNLCPGTYSVTVTDSHLCTSMQSVVITQPPILNTGVTFTNVTCNGACNGTATSAPTGGTPPYSYDWAPGTPAGDGTPTITGLCPGVYTVTVTDANGCIKTGTVTITQPNVLNVSISATALSCNGDCNSIAAAIVTGGTPPYTFDWLPGTPPGDGTSSINSLCAGTYIVNVTDFKGCLATATVVITQPTALNLITATTNASCFGVCDGSAAAIAGGGTPPYTFSWAPGGQTTPSITSQCANSYTVTVRDFNGCTIIRTVVISQPTQLLANPSVVTSISCAGALPCDGSATSAPTGGTGPYTYNWTPGTPTGDGTPTVTGLCAGTYNLVVTDSNSCTSTMPVTITQPLVLSAPITGSTSSCNICNGTATVTPAGGTGPYSYLWMPTGQTTATATGLCPNVTYTVTVTDSHGCTASNTVTILQSIIINITTSNTTLSCFASCNGIATANASGGTIPYSYIWTGSSGIVSLTQTASGLCAGSYTVTVSDAVGCFNTDTVIFTDPPQLIINTTFTNVTCGGACNGTATAAVTGGTGTYSYLWMPGAQTTATATALCAGTYTITVTDAKGCTAMDTVVVAQPTIVADNATITNAHCTLSDGTITVVPTGGILPYSYNWGPGTPTGDGTPTISGLLPGVYTLAITDGSGCIFNFNYLLNNIAGPVLSMAHTNVTCNNACNGTATVIASAGAGGYIYNWTPGVPVGAGTANVTALCGTTTYTIQVTDAAGCITFDTAKVINPPLISPNPTIVNESCGGSCNGSISLAPTGGTGSYTYVWMPGGSTSPSISGLCAGTYTATVTDANGCDSVLVITITSPPTLIVTLSSTNVLCNSACNGTATAAVVGGTGAGTYSYSWTNEPVTIVLPNIVNLCPNQYIVTVTDGNGCTAKDTVVITEPVALTSFTTQTNASCNAVCDGVGIVTASGGTLPYSYLWAPGAIANDTATGLCAGSYNAIVTDANGCVSAPPAITITQPPPIVPNATFTSPTCNGSCNGIGISAPSGGTAPYSFLWMPGAIANDTATGLCAGTYTLTVTDANGCSNTQTITLTQPSVLSANASSTSPTCPNSCNGSVISNPVGGTGTYTYSWSPGGAVTQSVSSLCPTVYTVIVTDAKNCKDTQSVAVVNPLPISLVVGGTPATCGSCDGTIGITPISGTGPFTYVWTIGGVSPPLPFAGQGTPNVSNVCAGLYNVLVTDANGCDSTFIIPMNNSSGPTGETENITNATCNGSCNGAASDTPIGGLSPYTYLWNDVPGTAIDTAFNLCAGNYFVQVTDANGCIHFSPVTIAQPAPILSNGVVTSAICSNVCTGAITITPSGGTPGYTYFWAPGSPAGQGTPTVTGLCPGTYTVTISDANLCVKVDSFTVGQSTPLAATIGAINISCASVCNGVAYVNITSGTAPYTIQWNDPAGQASDTATALCAGNYSVTIKDANGCSIILTTTITSAPALVPNLAITDASCGLCDGTATLAPTGGTGVYSYVWSNGQTVAGATSLCAGLYTVNIIDGVGCVTNVPVPVSNSGGPTSAIITKTNITCFGSCNGTVTGVTPVGGTAPYTFLWVAGGQTTPTLSGLCAGVYYVEITDANGCSLMDSVKITQPTQIMANQLVTAATCGACDGTITIAPSGGVAPYTILWNTGSTALALTNLCAGVYSVQITDANGCVQNIVVPVNNQNAPSLSVSSTNVTCNGSCNGTAGVLAVGGTTPYAYLWNDVSLQTNDTATALCAGTYFVQVTGADGCISVASVNITQPAPIGFSVAHTVNPLCNGNSNGSITTIPSGGTLSYTYSWSPSGGSAATASTLAANTYIVTVTDANGCSVTQSVTLINPVSLTISDVATPSSCNTIPDGSIDVTVGGGTTPYSYQWSGSSSATTEDLAGILSGSYTITVTDTNSCIIKDTVVLAASQTVVANAGNDTSFCQSGVLTLSAAGSMNGVNFNWFETPSNASVGSTSTVIVAPITGTTTYYVMVDNGTGCSDNDTVVVTSNPLPTANAGPDATIVIGSNTLIGGSPTTSVTGSTIQWSPIPGLDNATSPNPVAAPTVTTTYTVLVTSPQGCSSSDSMVVNVRPTIVFPDGISPNGDGVNDTWVIDGIELFPNCSVEVYNRWGELLFQSIGYKQHWDGTYKSKPLPVGTYYYVIDLKDPLFPDAYTGPITIMR